MGQRKRSRRGRPLSLSQELMAELERLIGSGLPQEVACRIAGVPYSTFRLWMSEAVQGRSGLYGEFLASITRARGKAEALAVARIRAAAADDWRAASWWLSHHPDTRDRWSESGAARKAETDLMAKVVSVLQTEIPDPLLRHRLLTALVAAGCGPLPQSSDDPA